MNNIELYATSVKRVSEWVIYLDDECCNVKGQWMVHSICVVCPIIPLHTVHFWWPMVSYSPTRLCPLNETERTPSGYRWWLDECLDCMPNAHFSLPTLRVCMHDRHSHDAPCSVQLWTTDLMSLYAMQHRWQSEERERKGYIKLWFQWRLIDKNLPDTPFRRQIDHFRTMSTHSMRNLVDPLMHIATPNYEHKRPIRLDAVPKGRAKIFCLFNDRKVNVFVKEIVKHEKTG